MFLDLHKLQHKMKLQMERGKCSGAHDNGTHAMVKCVCFTKFATQRRFAVVFVLPQKSTSEYLNCQTEAHIRSVMLPLLQCTISDNLLFE